MLKHLVRQKTTFADSHVRMSGAVSTAIGECTGRSPWPAPCSWQTCPLQLCSLRFCSHAWPALANWKRYCLTLWSLCSALANKYTGSLQLPCLPADGLAMIDVRVKPWPVLYANEAFAAASGQAVDDCTRQGFWEQFELADLGEKVGDVACCPAQGLSSAGAVLFRLRRCALEAKV